MSEFIGENRKDSSSLGKFLYGLLFVLVLPVALIYWASLLDRSIHWAVPPYPFVGIGIGSIGGAILLKGMYDLFVYGRGLPMNAYPPEQYVREGIYSWFSHPIYLGAVLLSAALALAFQSSSGFYIVTPLVALMLTALVLGYERMAMQKHFGTAMLEHHPIFSLPSQEDKATGWTKKLAMMIRVFIPWLIGVYSIEYARLSAGVSGLFSDSFLQNGLEFLWLIPYVYLLFRMILARTEKQLFHETLITSLASGASLYLYLVLIPFGIRIQFWPEVLILNLLTTVLAANYEAIWAILRRVSERLANSRHDWLFADGQFRIINHSLYAGLGAAVGTGIVAYFIGNNLAVLLFVLSSLVGGALFAQLWWGSSALLRPFGYWGAIMGAIAGAVLINLLFGIPLWSLATAGVLAAPFVQALGRLRCLVQGCCHGTPISADLGIRVWHPQSRVCALSGLKGQPIHITQLYSIAFNLLLAPLLWAMWRSHEIPASIIVGMYLILTGIERFAEDAYRGEKQTRTIRGLKESQWVAIAGLALGIVTTVIPSDLPNAPLGQFDIGLALTIIVGGLMAAFAMGMDFPKSSKRFSRLSG